MNNMKIPLEWLKEFVPIRLSPSELADRLTMAGLEVKAIEESAAGAVFDAEITPNRPDWLSIFGVAREVAAVMGGEFVQRTAYSVLRRRRIRLWRKRSGIRSTHDAIRSTDRRMKISIHDPKACPRYIGRVIGGAHVASSPEAMVKRLAAVGTRSINNIVDITNYVLFELGQPLHAFDLDKLQGDTIHVRFAKDGEEIITIDGVTRKLTRHDLVIADDAKAVALAGVMGGEETEVTETTRNIFLESACFDPMLVRRTARRLGLASESSYRFERGIPLESALLGSNRAVEFLVRIAGAQKIGPRVDAGKKTSQKRKVVLDVSRVQQLLGNSVDSKQIRGYLVGLGFELSGIRATSHVSPFDRAQGRRVTVSVPWFRRDIKEEVDLVEEIARIHGYDKISPQFPAIRETTVGRAPLVGFQQELRQQLTDLGYEEARTHSLISQGALKTLGQAGRPDLIRIKNPLSEDQEWMRPTLVVGLVQAARRNFFHQQGGVRLFELSNVYTLTKAQPKESLKLGILLGGNQPRHWQGKEKKYQWWDIKGTIEAVLRNLKLSGLKWERASLAWGVEESAAEIHHEGETLGILAQVNPKVLSQIDIERLVFAAELDVELLLRHSRRSSIRYHSLPKFPSVRRDIALELKESIAAAQVIALIKEKGGVLLEKVQIFDYYQGKQIFSGNKSLAFSLEYRSSDRTLTDQEVNQLHQKIAQELITQLGVKVR
jgi:phenylalanyl-tRNA synthetase beta chain